MSLPEHKILSVEKLSVTFPGPPEFQALDSVSFSLYKGRTLAVVGQSGSGKSITSLAIMGLLPREARISGRITLKGNPDLSLADVKDQRLVRGRRIGMIFQEPMSALNPLQKVGDQIREAILAHQPLSKAEAKRRVVAWLDKVRLPDPPAIYHRYPHQLSGGQKQRIMIAMAMCNHPDILLADEPTTALDVTVQQDVIRLMQQLQQEMNTAVLFITHDQALARQIADDYLVLEAGRVIENRRVVPSPLLSETPVVRTGIPLLKLENVDIVYSRRKGLFSKTPELFKAVNQVSCELYPGQTVGLVGESGCGKSTLSKAIMGLLPVHAGKITYKGRELPDNAAGWRSWRRNIQIILQDPYASLNPRLKVGEAIMEPILAHRLDGKAGAGAKMKALLESVELPANAADKYPHEFSGGQRQRISIARALAMNPELIICDESVSALDQKIQNQILELLAKLRQEKQLTYLFITHDLNVVRLISDHILVMASGRIVEQGPVRQVFDHPQQAYTKKLLSASLME